MKEKGLEISDEVLKMLNESMHKRTYSFAPATSLEHQHYLHRYQKITPMPAEISESLDKKTLARCQTIECSEMMEES